jgi:hypothetical protein
MANYRTREQAFNFKPRSARRILRGCWLAVDNISKRDPARALAIITALSRLQRKQSLRGGRRAAK